MFRLMMWMHLSIRIGVIRASLRLAIWVSVSALGEMVSHAQFEFLAGGDGGVRGLRLLLDDGKFKEADERAYQAMLTAARMHHGCSCSDGLRCYSSDPETIVQEFKKRWFVETKLFWDTYRHHGQFANLSVESRFEGPDTRYTSDDSRISWWRRRICLSMRRIRGVVMRNTRLTGSGGCRRATA